MKYYTYIGNFEIGLTLDDALRGCHRGACDADIASLVSVPYIAEQLAQVPEIDLVTSLRDTGAWDDDELQDRDINIERALWIACGDIVDEEYVCED